MDGLPLRGRSLTSPTNIIIFYFTLLYSLYSLTGNQHNMHPYNIHIYIVHVKHATKGNSFFFLDGRIFMSAGHDNLMLRDDTSAETLAMY